MKWIDVNDKLPPIAKRILFCTNQGVVGEGERLTHEWIHYRLSELYRYDEVTHWMYLPNKPKSKPVFDFNDFHGKYAMHCNSKAKAEIFCNYLDDVGEKWICAESYKNRIKWAINKENTCYLFNEGLFGDKNDFENSFHKGYTLLEFDDFDWSGQ